MTYASTTGQEDDTVLSIVIRGRGEHFTAGVDLDALASVDDVGND